jgi:general secretion pathway protein G
VKPQVPNTLAPIKSRPDVRLWAKPCDGVRNMTSARRLASAGFTLVELLIVVIILGILAAVVIPQFSGAAAEAKESALRADLNTVRQAISLYRVQHNEVYPGQANWAEFVSQLTSTTNTAGALTAPAAGGKYGPYLRTQFPTNQIAGNALGQVVATMPSGPSGTDGWMYCNTTGEFRANTAGTAPSGELYFNL